MRKVVRDAGILFCVGVLGVGVMGPVNAVSIANPGFETMESTDDGLPHSYGDWSGDVSGIMTARQGISPRSGLQMLQLVYTGFTGPGSATASEVDQLVDVSGYSAGTVFSAAAYFNRVVATNVDTQFEINLFAYSGTPSGYSGSGWLARGISTI